MLSNKINQSEIRKKTFLLKRSKHYLFILTGGFKGMLLAIIDERNGTLVNKKCYNFYINK
ncbi:hypothetical protein [Gottfriedia acidiceleris]|uniref:hypothetical protein n=1 Tax=Gottfriedia acidiceleris TaxID=371036 RepID=UPI00101CF1FD|nr:hypothetical protein [Gottfriedia acidiceleris]